MGMLLQPQVKEDGRHAPACVVDQLWPRLLERVGIAPEEILRQVCRTRLAAIRVGLFPRSDGICMLLRPFLAGIFVLVIGIDPGLGDRGMIIGPLLDDVFLALEPGFHIRANWLALAGTAVAVANEGP